MFRILFFAAILMFGQSSFAGGYVVHCFSNIDDCSAKLKDIVTDKFTDRFPSSKFEIVVIAEFQPYSNGGGVGYAVAGVAPNIEIAQMPLRRFAATIRIADRQMNGFDVTKKTEEVMRDAVQSLMAACDRSANCDVYKPYK